MVNQIKPETRELIESEILEYIRLSNILKLSKYGTDEWFKTHQQWNGCYGLLKTITGLSDKRLNDLLAGRTNTATYWLADGTIRKDH